jgi:thymidylate synthase
MSKFKYEFDGAISILNAAFLEAPEVPSTSWQSSKAPDVMVEKLNVSLDFNLKGLRLKELQKIVKPNLPWAEEHFLKERVSGDPINPGETWRIWPYASSANTHRREGEKDPQFDHSYAERYWPKFAGQTEGGRLEETPGVGLTNWGYRFEYGDLNDLIEALIAEPLTRQAYLPIWFPEDLGAVKLKKRVPCSLGYHFIMRDQQLHLVYFMRSCDYVRHFRDDVYLTIRLQLWVLEQLQLGAPEKWDEVTLGSFTMHITSLHMFKSDQDNLKSRTYKELNKP